MDLFFFCGPMYHLPKFEMLIVCSTGTKIEVARVVLSDLVDRGSLQAVSVLAAVLIFLPSVGCPNNNVRLYMARQESVLLDCGPNLS